MFYLHHTPPWLRWLFPRGLQWEGMPSPGSEVFLTFDDGPHPEATPWVLDQLQQYGMKASFFCIGKNVVAHPDLYDRIVAEGHAVGNHTMHHVNGKITDTPAYTSNIAQAAAHIDSLLFRPPYGQLTGTQAKAIRRQFPGMQIVMWSVLTGDFDIEKSGQHCFDKSRKHLKPGSIILFHDSAKALPRLREALPLMLDYLQEKGWHSAALPAKKDRP